MYRNVVSACRLSVSGRGTASRRAGLRWVRPSVSSTVQPTVSVLSDLNLHRHVRVLHTFNTPDEHLPSPAFKVQVDGSPPPFRKLLAANRGEISCRINRAASELGIMTAGIYSYEGK